MAGDENTTASCVDGACEYTCAPGHGDCDEDPTTCEVDFTAEPNCGGCGVDCGYDDCQLIDDAYACNDPVELSAGRDHVCAIKRDGSIWCWGANTWGQLGVNTALAINSAPVQITSLPDFRAVKISQGLQAGCAQSDLGAFACWRGNDQSEAVEVTGDGVPDITEFELGNLGDNLALLGPNHAMKLFSFDLSTQTVTMTNAATGTGLAVSTSGGHRCVVLADNSMKCWGSNSYGQVGNGSGGAGQTVSAPTAVAGSFQAVGTGEEHTCALTTTGDVECWGRNRIGSSGTSNSVHGSPTTMVTGVAEALFVGRSHNAVLEQGGTLVMFGDNDQSQCVPSGGDQITPVGAPLSTSDKPVSAALGSQFTCALLESGLVKCWGANGFGQLGNGGTTPSSVPVTVLF